MNRAYIWLCAVVAAVFVLSILDVVRQGPSDQGERVLAYSDLLMQADAGRVRSVVIQGTKLHGRLMTGEQFRTTVPANDPHLVFILHSRGARITIRNDDFLTTRFVSVGPFVFVGIFLLVQLIRARRKFTLPTPLS